MQLRASPGDANFKFARTNLGAAIDRFCCSGENQHEQCRQEPHPVYGRLGPFSSPPLRLKTPLHKWISSLKTDII